MKTSEIRKEARESLKGKWGKAICIVLAFMAISFVAGFIQEFFGEESTISRTVDLVYTIINIPLSFGLLICFMKFKRGEDIRSFDYFKEGFSRFGKAWGILAHTLLKLLVPTILLIILIIVEVSLFTTSIITKIPSMYLLISSILLVIISIYMVIKSLLYVFAYNISYDNPELTSKECVLKSAELMKGNRKKYFLLELSFIGWGILVLFTFGIGTLWLTPYMQIATICFYEKLIKPETQKVDDVIKSK